MIAADARNFQEEQRFRSGHCAVHRRITTLRTAQSLTPRHRHYHPSQYRPLPRVRTFALSMFRRPVVSQLDGKDQRDAQNLCDGHEMARRGSYQTSSQQLADRPRCDGFGGSQFCPRRRHAGVGTACMGNLSDCSDGGVMRGEFPF